MDWISVYAPATIGNIGPGFDVLGLAIRSLGDIVEARRADSGVTISSIECGNGLSRNPNENTAGIAAREALAMIGCSGGVEIRLIKRVRCGSGLGSSASSAAAGAVAVNLLYGESLSDDQLIHAATTAEEVVSGGYFADNTAPSILGGATLTRCYDPLDITKIGTLSELTIVVVTPDIIVLTRDARRLLPKEVSMEAFVSNMANACLITAAFSKDDYELFSRCLDDIVIEPHRKALITGFDSVKEAAIAAGADGVAISGSGPTIFAVTRSARSALRIESEMVDRFADAGVASSSLVTEIDFVGARQI